MYHHHHQDDVVDTSIQVACHISIKKLTYKNPKSNPTKHMPHHSGSLGLVREKQGNAGEEEMLKELLQLIVKGYKAENLTTLANALKM